MGAWHTAMRLFKLPVFPWCSMHFFHGLSAPETWSTQPPYPQDPKRADLLYLNFMVWALVHSLVSWSLLARQMSSHNVPYTPGVGGYTVISRYNPSGNWIFIPTPPESCNSFLPPAASGGGCCYVGSPPKSPKPRYRRCKALMIPMLKAFWVCCFFKSFEGTSLLPKPTPQASQVSHPRWRS